MHELIYPVLQGYDSVVLESDLTIVGSDQLFNEAIGRELQSKHGQLPQTVITSTITPGLDGGPKQSKSLNNYVGLAQSAEEKFGRDVAEAIVGRYHGAAAAQRARRSFLDVFSERNPPETMPVLPVAEPRLPVFDLVLMARPEFSRSVAAYHGHRRCSKGSRLMSNIACSAAGCGRTGARPRRLCWSRSKAGDGESDLIAKPSADFPGVLHV